MRTNMIMFLSKPFRKSRNLFAGNMAYTPCCQSQVHHRFLLGLSALVVVAASFLTVGTARAQSTQPPTVDFLFDVAPILSKRCFECHGDENPKGDFRIEDSAALAGFVVANDLANSSLWTDYLRADPNDSDSLLMPPKSKGGPLSGSELAVIRTWIEDGAQIPETYHLGDASTHTVKPEAPVITSQIGRFWVFIGYFHPAVVHFPLALLLAGGLGALLSFFVGVRAQDFAFYCLLLGALGSVAAAIMGWSFAAEQGYPGWRVLPSDEEGENFFIHRWLGVAVSVLSCLLLIIAAISRRKNDARSSAAWRVGLMIVALLVAWVGHEGGELTYPGLFDKAFHRLNGTTEEKKDEAPPEIPPNFRMRANL
jgi:uncharacterized membrane protein